MEPAPSLEAAVEGAKALVLITRWEEYRRLPELLARRPTQPVVIDHPLSTLSEAEIDRRAEQAAAQAVAVWLGRIAPPGENRE